MKKRNWEKILIALLVVGIISGCEGKDKESDSLSANSVSDDVVSADEAEIVEENNHLAVNTIIAYSAGDDSQWSYGNQRKEFPDKEQCYVRVASVLTTDKKKFKDNAVLVTYRFTGTEKCEVNVSDGILEEIDTGEKNIKEYTRYIYANIEKEATEDFVIFQYKPSGAESVQLEVFYDDQVAERYDTLNSIYFIK